MLWKLFKVMFSAYCKAKSTIRAVATLLSSHNIWISKIVYKNWNHNSKYIDSWTLEFAALTQAFNYYWILSITFSNCLFQNQNYKHGTCSGYPAWKQIHKPFQKSKIKIKIENRPTNFFGILKSKSKLKMSHKPF